MSLFVRERDRKCVICGKTENLQCGHLFSRVAFSTRWDLVNCHCNCSGCNLRHEFNSAPYTLWFIKKYGVNTYEKLHFRFSHTKKYTDSDLRILLIALQELRENLKVNV